MNYMGQIRKFQFEEGPFGQGIQGIVFILQEVLLEKKLKVKMAKYVFL